VFIAGGSLGGIAAALKILQLQQKRPLHIVLSEETNWLGGQATSQGVSALDENFLVETTGCAANYQKFRRAIRNNYKNNHNISDSANRNQYFPEIKHFNPGNCWVSYLAFEPKVALEEINNMLALSVVNSSLKVLYRHKPFYTKHQFGFLARKNKPGKIKAIYLVNLDTGERIAVKAHLYLDATDCGDLLAITGQEYTIGEDAKELTNEPHAPAQANTDNVQDFTYPFVVEFRPGEDHTIDKPPLYDELNKEGKFSFNGYKMYADAERVTPEGEQQKLLPFWTYRRLIDAGNFMPTENQDVSEYPNDISMINWGSNDVRGKNIIDQTAATQADRLAYGKLVSLGFLYWLQTEAPRDDNTGKGYPELFLRKDVLDTADGLSKFPYIRESRRIKAQYTVVEQDIAKVFQKGKRAKLFTDSVGIGLYPIDIHGVEAVPGTGQLSRPFQIPLGSLIPKIFSGVLPACKNIGVTHITNGAYRLHPIEWSIGEAQGGLSFYCLRKKVSPAKVLTNLSLLRDFQRMLIESGVPVFWFNDLPPEHPAFAAGQFLALTAMMPGTPDNLHFYPEKPITRGEAAFALAKLFALRQHPAEVGYSQQAVTACLTKSLMTATKDGNFHPEKELSSKDFLEITQQDTIKDVQADEKSTSPLPSAQLGNSSVSRAQFAIWLYAVAQSKKLFGKV
jgi:hypothetical protein